MNPINPGPRAVVLGAPADWREDVNGPCIGLPVIRDYGLQYSYWSLTWKERISVLFGRPIRLCVRSTSHPPVWLEVKELGK